MKSVYKKCLTCLAIWAVCFILFWFVYMLVLSGQRKTKLRFEKQLTETKQMYEFVKRASGEQTRARLNSRLEELRSILGEFVIDFEDSANLVFDISRMANEKGLGSFRIGSREKAGGSEIPTCKYICENHIDISFTAGFNQFASFLNALERHRPVIFVDGFKITREDKNPGGHKVDMNLTVFVKKRPES